MPSLALRKAIPLATAGIYTQRWNMRGGFGEAQPVRCGHGRLQLTPTTDRSSSEKHAKGLLTLFLFSISFLIRNLPFLNKENCDLCFWIPVADFMYFWSFYHVSVCCKVALLPGCWGRESQVPSNLHSPQLWYIHTQATYFYLISPKSTLWAEEGFMGRDSAHPWPVNAPYWFLGESEALACRISPLLLTKIGRASCRERV